ncbi:MAG TPA: DNA polymerase II [Steroidobacteraceae bacterium]|nr:DNA polymerase II [Steroidobacteraceae bacterium]
MSHRGFITQATYRVGAAGADGRRRPVVHLHGRLEDGKSFLVRDDRQRPHFYIRARDTERARPMMGACAVVASGQRSFDGEPVDRLEFELPGDVPAVRDRLHAAAVDTFEADVRFAVRYLIDRGIKGGCVITGEPQPAENVDCVFDNPTLHPAPDVSIEPRVLSFDIETNASGDRLLAISLFGLGLDEVLIVDSGNRAMPEQSVRCENEHAALSVFCERVRTWDPDVLTGWNIVDFDLTVLARVAARVGHPFVLGRDDTPMRLRAAEGYFGSGQASIPGRLVLDGIDLLRGAFVRMDDYSLEAVARTVLGEGKAVKGDVRNRMAEIVHNYRHDLPAFALYARTDARLAHDILRKLNLVPLAFARSRLSGMTPDRVSASIASFDFLYLSELRPLRIVAPSVRSNDSRVSAAQHGGHVLEPVAGLHDDVWVFDFKSLYPSVIRTFNIDPLSYVAAAAHGADLIETPGGWFRREPAILPRMLDELFPRREAARQRGDEVAAHAIKILMNSFYGVLGTPACRFYNPALANSITGIGRELLLWSKQWFERAGYVVLYGDTDSLFVQAGADAADASRKGLEIAIALNADLARYLSARWRVRSRLELKFEKLYVKLFLPLARGSTRGASKRYVGLRHGTGLDKLEFVGMEVVRRDWTALAKQVQLELYRRLFGGQPVAEYLADVVKRVRTGELDETLVYRKNLRKGADAYTATTPPHVAAARKSTRPPGRTVSYVMTVAGPEPADEVHNALDREHYVIRQVQPVAEPVLATLGLDFETVVGDRRQLDLLGGL